MNITDDQLRAAQEQIQGSALMGHIAAIARRPSVEDMARLDDVQMGQLWGGAAPFMKAKVSELKQLERRAALLHDGIQAVQNAKALVSRSLQLIQGGAKLTDQDRAELDNAMAHIDMATAHIVPPKPAELLAGHVRSQLQIKADARALLSPEDLKKLDG